ncbi:MAG: ribosome small subunit-dependent GTPase A [Saprospiraceae bacterium]
MKGLITKSTGSWYAIRSEDHSLFMGRIVGKIKLLDRKFTNPIAVGDYVEFEIEDVKEKTAIISSIMPRQNYVVRQSPRKKHQLHVLASNIDQAFVIVTVVEPDLKQGFIDRFLLMTEPFNIPVTILFNKKDLYSEENIATFNTMKEMYSNIGYDVCLVSATHGDGIEALKVKLKDKTTLISGQSGVGKSSLINVIDSSITLETGVISDFSGKGQHTTTFAEMFFLESGGAIIDTPGIKTLGFSHLSIEDISHNFREIFDASSDCKFHNCTHRNEPKCAVKNAVENGQIAFLRYQNYLNLLQEVEDQNYWELHNNI